MGAKKRAEVYLSDLMLAELSVDTALAELIIRYPQVGKYRASAGKGARETRDRRKIF